MSKKSTATELKVRHCVDLEWEWLFYVSVKVGKSKDLEGGGSVKQHLGVRFLLSGCAAVTVGNRFECGQRQPTGHQSHFHTYTAALFLDIIQMEVRVRTLMSDVAELNMKQC